MYHLNKMDDDDDMVFLLVIWHVCLFEGTFG